ncbi:ABC transporter permease [Phenylobacterium montanum]|uniref:ABC transporter permease n=1 Tax=Phenylobacterium montanum TaxID=2823693 RepID=A0A975G3E2_9CAUL|nr:ABC transporter permease [Caulobacter sp. S6]QUD89772.1 ABC transporter permease [Caulobacter sp. S6]
MTAPGGARLTAKGRRIWALVRKEGRQVVRDPSSFAIGVVLPLMLILLFGYAMSLDVKHVPIALVIEDRSTEAAEIAASFQLSPYFDVHRAGSTIEAREMMLAQKVDGIVDVPADFTRRAANGDASVQILVHGVDGNRARIIEAYAAAAVAQTNARRAAEGEAGGPGGGRAVVESQLWFNAANDTRYFLVPGLIVLIITLIGAFMTSMVVAREWERGTFEALFVSPVRTDEILIGKTIPYFLLGMGGLALCMLSARYLFDVPFRGSLLTLIGASMLYLLVSVATGLLISSTFKSQFLSSQVTLVATFMPALMLSGFIYDLHSVPTAVRLISYGVPARYYVSLLQTLFLAGDVWSVVLPNAAVLAVVAAVMLGLTRRATRKQLG